MLIAKSDLVYAKWDYIAPRVEFCLNGFANEKHVFAFERIPMKFSTGDGDWLDGDGAQCLRCGTQLICERENLREHGRLHLAVELAKRNA